MRVLRRRLGQSKTIVVGLPTDDSSSKSDDFLALDVTEREICSCQWLGQAQDVSDWLDYFKTLSKDNTNNNKEDDRVNDRLMLWFGLNYSGRLFGSGIGKPRILEIMGQYLRPVDMLSEGDG